MHFRSTQSKQSRNTSSLTDMLTYKHSSATVQTTELPLTPPESPEILEVETPGISCWDFAYPTGKCSLPASMTKNCCFSRRHMPKSKPEPWPTTEKVAHSHDAIKDTQHPRPQPQPHQQTHSAQKSKKHSHGHSLSLSSSNSSKSSDSSTDSVDSKTYLLSSPTQDSILNLQTQDTISSLLATPNTKIVYLVPQDNIVCPKVCALMRLPRAKGASFQVLPVPPEIIMCCSAMRRDENSADGWDMADMVGVQEVATKVVKNTKVRHFDGYVAFVDEREAWMFLELVGKKVSEAAAKPAGRKGK